MTVQEASSLHGEQSEWGLITYCSAEVVAGSRDLTGKIGSRDLAGKIGLARWRCRRIYVHTGHLIYVYT